MNKNKSIYKIKKEILSENEYVKVFFGFPCRINCLPSLSLLFENFLMNTKTNSIHNRN